MGKLYFSGVDTYNCLPISHIDKDTTKNSIYFQPHPVQNISNIEFTHFYSVYQKQDSGTPYSWFINGLGLEETKVFSSAHCIKQVAACKNCIVGLSEDGTLYRINLEADDNRELVSFKTSSVKLDEDTRKVAFKKITANENNIYGLQSTTDVSRIYKIEDRIECIAEFPRQYIEEFAAGYGHFVTLSDTGALWNWGHAGRSELASSGDEISAMKVCDTPKRVDFFDGLPNMVVKVVCGGWHTLALTSDGDIYSWGWNESGQLGHDGPPGVPYPLQLGSGLDPVTDIAAGSRHSVALLKSGRVYSWGRNEEGQTGLGDKKEPSPEPVEVAKCWEGTACKIKCSKWSTFICTE